LSRIGHPGRLLETCSEQGKLPAAKAFRLAERDKTMSEQQEQTTGYMAELDAWTEETVIRPLHSAALYNSEDWDQETPEAACANVRSAIRHKVLESYKNGIKAGFAKAHQAGRKETSHAQAKTR